jgi:nicotinamidase-related amidase
MMAAPENTALVLMDFQTAVLGNVGEKGDAVLANAKAVAGRCRELGVPVMHVRVAFGDQDYGSVPARNKVFTPLAAHRMLGDGSDAAAIVPELAPIAGEVVVVKTRFGAFSTTNLDTHLRARGIDSLVLAGVSTSGVVLSTVRDAADRDYRLTVLSDACADPDDAVHEVLISKVLARQADVVTCAQFLQGAP